MGYKFKIKLYNKVYITEHVVLSMRRDLNPILNRISNNLEKSSQLRIKLGKFSFRSICANIF